MTAEHVGDQQAPREAAESAERRAGGDGERRLPGPRRHALVARRLRRADTAPEKEEDEGEGGARRHRQRSTTRAASSTRTSALDFTRRSVSQHRASRRESAAREAEAEPRAMASTTCGGLRTTRAI